jgi:hypothetical protein
VKKKLVHPIVSAKRIASSRQSVQHARDVMNSIGIDNTKSVVVENSDAHEAVLVAFFRGRISATICVAGARSPISDVTAGQKS